MSFTPPPIDTLRSRVGCHVEEILKMAEWHHKILEFNRQSDLDTSQIILNGDLAEHMEMSYTPPPIDILRSRVGSFQWAGIEKLPVWHQQFVEFYGKLQDLNANQNALIKDFAKHKAAAQAIKDNDEREMSFLKKDMEAQHAERTTQASETEVNLGQIQNELANIKAENIKWDKRLTQLNEMLQEMRLGASSKPPSVVGDDT